jgi:hypothetical protein
MEWTHLLAGLLVWQNERKRRHRDTDSEMFIRGRWFPEATHPAPTPPPAPPRAEPLCRSPTLTGAEREAVEWFASYGYSGDGVPGRHSATLRGLLQRTAN